MTGAVIGMGMINSDIQPIGTGNGCSMIEKISPDSIFVSTQGFENNEYSSDFGMKSASRASSRTSTTEPFEDVGDGEEESENLAIAAAVAAVVESINESVDEVLEAREKEKEDESARRHTVGTCTAKRFGFSTITVREYPRDLGDNVTVMGPPIGLSWKHQDEIVYDLVEYDDACQETRRTQSELKMPSKHRDQLLRDMGYSKQDIQDAVKRSNIARNQRKRTVETLKLAPLQEAFEKVVRVGSKPLRRKDSHLKMDKRKTI